MVALLIALCVIVPVVELAVIIQVGHWIGIWETLFLLLAVSLFGAWLVKVQGVSVVRRIGQEISARRVPGRPMVDAVLIVVAGFLILIPGFVTTILGLLLLIPATRVPVREYLLRRWTRRYSLAAVSRVRLQPEQLGSDRAIDAGPQP